MSSSYLGQVLAPELFDTGAEQMLDTVVIYPIL